MKNEEVARAHIIAVIEESRVTAFEEGSPAAIAEASDIWKLTALISALYPQGAIITPQRVAYTS